jgi:hypothetical protein
MFVPDALRAAVSSKLSIVARGISVGRNARTDRREVMALSTACLC